MKIKTQIYLDRFAVKPVIIFLNIWVKLLGFILQIDHSLDLPLRRIAVCKFKGMGSIIQATPLLKNLRKKYPKAEILFVSSVQNRGILEKIDIIDRMVLLNDKKLPYLIPSFFKVWLTLISRRISLYIDLEIYSSFSSFVTTVSLAKNRVGYYVRSSNYRMGIYTHMMFFNVNLPIHQVYLQIARLLGMTDPDDSLLKFTSSQSTFKWNEKEYEGGKQKYIVINPNASDLRLERRWPAEKFVELIEMIRTHLPDYPVFFIGSRQESTYVEGIYKMLKDQSFIYNVSGKTTLDQLIILIDNATVMITNDTGPMHLAFSQQTPAVALFGPCLPSQYGNFRHIKAIHKKVYCSPCVHEFIMPPCKGNNVCMKKISVNEVFNAVKEILDTSDPLIEEHEKILFLEDDGNPLGILQRAQKRKS